MDPESRIIFAMIIKIFAKKLMVCPKGKKRKYFAANDLFSNFFVVQKQSFVILYNANPVGFYQKLKKPTKKLTINA